jgi:hypothetical protein
MLLLGLAILNGLLSFFSLVSGAVELVERFTLAE